MSLENDTNLLSRRFVLRGMGAAAAAAATAGLWVPEAYAGQAQALGAPAAQSSDNLLRVNIDGSDGSITGINVMRYFNVDVGGQLQKGGFFDDVLNFMALQRGDTLDRVLVSSKKGRNAQLHTHFRWDDGSRVDMGEYEENHPDRKAMLVDRPAIDGKPQSFDYLFKGDSVVLDLGKMLASNKPGVAETARKLEAKYRGREVNLTPEMVNQALGSDPSVQKTVKTYVDAVEAVYGAGHAATKDLRNLQYEKPAAVLGRMVTPALGREGGMYHDLTQGDGAIKVTSVVEDAEAGRKVRQDESYAPAQAHRVDLSRPVIYWGISYGIVNPVTGELKKDRTYGVFEGTKLHHVISNRGADVGDLLGDPTLQATMATRTYDRRVLAEMGLDMVGNSRDARVNHMMVWTGDKGLYKKMVGVSDTVGPDLATITNSVRPSWIDGPTKALHYMAFQGVKTQPKG